MIQYTFGKQQKRFPEKAERIEDCVVANERLDSRLIEGVTSQFTTFMNISFLECRITNVKFTQCVFIDCYFRKATFGNVDFTGSKFINCNFDRLKVRSSNFKYCDFSNCLIPYFEMEHNFPIEPNLRRSLAKTLKVQARALDRRAQYRFFLKCEMSAYMEQLKCVCFRASTYYKEKYNFCECIVALIRFLRILASKCIWGYGEDLMPLLLFSLVLFPLFFALLFWSAEISQPNSFWQSVVLSFSSIAGYAGVVFPTSMTFRITATIQCLVNLMFFGLFVSVLYGRIKK